MTPEEQDLAPYKRRYLPKGKVVHLLKMTAEEREKILARFERRYLPKGTVAHLLNGNPLRDMAECGRSPWDSDEWRGTGTQEEYENAASWPICKRCLHVASIPS